jgi:hypothetical protein
VTLGEIRLIAFQGMPAAETLTVTTHPSNPDVETMNVAETQAMTAARGRITLVRVFCTSVLPPDWTTQTLPSTAFSVGRGGVGVRAG